MKLHATLILLLLTSPASAQQFFTFTPDDIPHLTCGTYLRALAQSPQEARVWARGYSDGMSDALIGVGVNIPIKNLGGESLADNVAVRCERNPARLFKDVAREVLSTSRRP
ncbi:MAG: hypothetical protein J2P54_24945 [Bradyrhizobiaceae bacterium]|nr:hypothetical protein [Bradyrhizobiaceae bacterium]